MRRRRRSCGARKSRRIRARGIACAPFCAVTSTKSSCWPTPGGRSRLRPPWATPRSTSRSSSSWSPTRSPPSSRRARWSPRTDAPTRKAGRQEASIMSIEVKVPVLPESVAEATLVNWHKKVGDAVSRDENLVDVETDKVVLELPAPAAGVLTEIRKPDGATVVAQEVIAVIDPAASGAAAAAPAAAAAAPAPAVPTPATAAASALPAARKLMAEQQLGPSEVSGSGRGGRITKADVLAATQARSEGPGPGATAAPPPAARAAPPPAPPAVALPAGLSARPEQRVPMSRLRQRVA